MRIHTFAQPKNKPQISQSSVQENRLGQWWSSHTPSAAPNRVGSTMDHPTNPRNASDRQNSTLCVFPRSIRVCLDSTCRTIRSADGESFSVDGGFDSGMFLQLQEPAHQIRFQLGLKRQILLFALGLGLELPRHVAFQFFQIRSANCSPRRNRNLWSALD